MRKSHFYQHNIGQTVKVKFIFEYLTNCVLGLFDINRILWGSWLIEYGNPNKKVWFAGDTAYCPVFQEIGSKLGPFDLSLIPIGAYNPRFFMKYQHVNHEEAVQLHQDVQSKRSIAIHCCTFPLTLEPMDEPPQLLLDHLVMTFNSLIFKI